MSVGVTGDYANSLLRLDHVARTEGGASIVSKLSNGAGSIAPGAIASAPIGPLGANCKPWNVVVAVVNGAKAMALRLFKPCAAGSSL